LNIRPVHRLPLLLTALAAALALLAGGSVALVAATLEPSATRCRRCSLRARCWS
jgi:hypothetical protein